MHISRVYIENFKCFKGGFKLNLNEGVNVLVGNNEAGKSTIIEAIHLALTGLVNGRYLKNELTQYIFNIDVLNDYIKELSNKGTPIPPHILIEIYIEGNDIALLEGTWNSEKSKSAGISLKIHFDDKYQKEYEDLINAGGVKTLPIEYYTISWSSFAQDEGITARAIPIKSALIDSSSNKTQNGSDVYISRIVKEFLESREVVEISQAHRKMKEVFMDDEAVRKINDKIGLAAKISEKNVKLSVELSSKNAWESSLMTYLDDIPFHFIGKGEQCIIKTKLALSHNKAKEANLLLLEEPENHLSHSKLNQLLNDIKGDNTNKQIIISTHSSYVANKLGLENLILLNNRKTLSLSDLTPDTYGFFKKLAGYDTLRLLLCSKAILVEGDSDELIVQKAYIKTNGKLPIESGIDVISVGTSFLRFLEIAVKVNKTVCVVTDNDGNVEALNDKYKEYLGDNAKDFIKICFDSTVDTGNLVIGDKKFNYNTLEPKLLKINSVKKFNTVFGTTHQTEDEMHKYMKSDKTGCALKIFETKEEITFPQYILDSIQ